MNIYFFGKSKETNKEINVKNLSNELSDDELDAVFGGLSNEEMVQEEITKFRDAFLKNKDYNVE